MVKKRVRRQFDAAFKVEAVRRMEERQAVKIPLATITRDLDVRPEQLRMWADQVAAERGSRTRAIGRRMAEVASKRLVALRQGDGPRPGRANARPSSVTERT